MTVNTVISGIPGVGASKVCEQARRQLGDEYTLINVGDVMLEEALEHGLASSRQELSRLRLRDQRALQRRAGEYIARKSDSGPLLINTHLVVETPLGYIPGMSSAVLSDIDPSALVIIDAADETIRERRERSSRSYEQFSAAINFHRQLQSVAALSYSFESNAPVHHLLNEDDVEEASERLTRLVGVMSNLAQHP